ncbi:MAG: MotA/TolQ/ExbB proton channel family protein [Acidobacteriota bacterium]
MIDMILRGGWVMVPIILGSIVAIAMIIERFWFFRSIKLDVAEFAGDVFNLVQRGQIERALGRCERVAHPLAPVLRAGIEHAAEVPWEIQRVMEREGQRQIQKAESNLNYLAVVIGVEPLLGFLGTILGLIKAFMSWERYSSAVTVSALAAGIYQAMITTAAGLIVAIPCYVLYNLLLGRVSSTAQELNHYGDELVSLLVARQNSTRVAAQ